MLLALYCPGRGPESIRLGNVKDCFPHMLWLFSRPLFAIINNGYDGNANLTLQTISVIIAPKFAISQSEAKSNVLISYDIKSLTCYPAISWSLSSKVMLPYDKLQRGLADKQTTRNLRFSWCFAVERRRKNLSRQN